MTVSDLTRDELRIDPHSADLLFREARSANSFTDEPVSEATVREIYELVKWAPTAFNQQPLRVILSRTPESRERLVPLMAEGNRAKTAAAPLVAILAADTEFAEHLPRLVPHAPNVKDLFADDERRHTSAQFNATLQVGYFLLGVRAAGLAAGPMTGFDKAGVDAEFFPDGRHRSLAVVNIGRPDENAYRDRLPRLGFDEVVTSI
ncbi:3-hydroxypropanoate dehydrogenase [Actinopolymorpha cephalotaxi]|uniref:3-hydroxypropanoate dehydrogenase n=1 Tax=Actinopolymorpha cephalotaxi TaxID=504797 RepID=A0A1I2S2T7_9ACTN|nr:malonic semialdehyde reductase [Actinopolymorpha cephalotaxi]NYH83882.1 nitroreductase [Actinopolymorpha cephalotaxi]SFG47070.1 3-hydroxypropanoate dehydrogenase [Actinopolymorpha cephalotaxi]